MLSSSNNHRISGYSLVELVVTIVLTAITMAILYTVFANTQSRSIEPVDQIKAAELAQAYIEEILLKKYDENSPAGNGARCNSPGNPACSATLGPDGGETRAQYDDVDDYNGLSESPPLDALGNPRNGFANFSADVTVSYAGGDLGFANGDMKRIQVDIGVRGNTYTFSAYKGNF